MITVGSSSYLALTYNQLRYGTDLTYTCQVSGDLQIWNSGANYTTPVSVTNNPDGVTQTVVTRALTPTSSASQQFMRLVATGP